MPTFLLRNASLLDLEQGKLIERMQVVVADGKIAERWAAWKPGKAPFPA